MRKQQTAEEFVDKMARSIESYMSPERMAHKIDGIQEELRGVANELEKIIETLDTHYGTPLDEF